MRRLPVVDEVEQIEAIERLEERYRRAHGAKPFNVSHWDPSPEMVRSLAPMLRPDHGRDPLTYVYSYTLDLGEQVLRKLGFSPRHGALFTPSGTLSMQCAMHWLRAMGLRRITATGPLYFPLLHQAAMSGVEVEIAHMVRRGGRYHLPARLARSRRPLWITNPVYSTGVRLSEDDQATLRRLARSGVPIVLDECLAFPGEEIGPRIAVAPDVVALYAPQKGLSINGLKFSAIVFASRYQSFFDEWADVLCGPLNLTNAAAVRHFLSRNFDVYRRRFGEAVTAALGFVREQAAQTGCGELDRDPLGHFVNFVCPGISSERGESARFLWKMAEATAAMVMPGSRNHFDRRIGFCFRINLALDGPQFRGAIARLLRFLRDAAR